MRHNKRQVKVGNVYLGGDNPILVQSMLNVKSKDVQGNVRQAVALEKEGCQIVRVSVPTLEDVRLIEAIKNEVKKTMLPWIVGIAAFTIFTYAMSHKTIVIRVLR